MVDVDKLSTSTSIRGELTIEQSVFTFPQLSSLSSEGVEVLKSPLVHDAGSASVAFKVAPDGTPIPRSDKPSDGFLNPFDPKGTAGSDNGFQHKAFADAVMRLGHSRL